MKNLHSCIKRFVLASGLALGVLATAALSGPVAGADAPRPAASRTPTPPPVTATPTAAPGFAGPLPQMTAVEAKALGTEATLSFITTQPSAVTIDYQPASGPAAGGQSPAQGYATSHERKLTGLKSNTTYDVTVTATTQSGEKHTAKASFTTAKKRVRVILQSIDIKHDGDLIGDGEPVWFVLPGADGRPTPSHSYMDGALCWPIEKAVCKYGEFGEGRITPRNFQGNLLTIVYAEENFDRFPGVVSLQVWAKEDDAIGGASIIECLTNPGCPVGDDAEQVQWQVPQSVEYASQTLTVHANDARTGFESVLTFSVELTHNNSPYGSRGRNKITDNWFSSFPTAR